MRVTTTIADFRWDMASAERPLGLVPTMGALHDGHMALVHRARAENATVVASIFVNPGQFGLGEDLSQYPRDMEADLAKLEEANVEMVFTPPVEEVYPAGFGTYVDVGDVAGRLEGKARVGHFRGVATIVCKLINIVRPDRTYFGQKDAQQSLVVKRLNSDLNLGTKIVVVPTIRDSDGRALSSRNGYLSSVERKAATVLYRSLVAGRNMCADGVVEAEAIRTHVRAIIDAEPLAQIDYVSLSDARTLEELDLVENTALLSLAVYFGKTRLIDNITVRVDS